MSSKKRGVLVSLEGPDGAGKSTHVSFLKAWFEEHGYTVTITREPGGTPAGEAIRNILLNADKAPMTEVLLFAASRAEHLASLIHPALQAGHIVITDRFCDSTIAYQGYGRGLLQMALKMETTVHHGFYPDHTLFFDIPFEESVKRLALRLEKQDKFDQETLDFKQRVYDGYYRCMLPNSRRQEERFVKINANQTIPGVQKDLKAWLMKTFPAQLPLI